MRLHRGGCLCEAIRYETEGDPLRVTICHCRFCQRATGSAYMVEPVFSLDRIRVTTGTPTVYTQRSAGSGKLVHAHFCAACGTKLYLTFERFPGTCGIYAGTFDEPDWFEVGSETSKHIFLDVARPDSIVPSAVPIFDAHAISNAGEPLEPKIFGQPKVVGRRAEP